MLAARAILCLLTQPLPGLPAGDRENAIKEGLSWLARHQCENGSWSTGCFQQGCRVDKCRGLGEASTDVGKTGLALVAFIKAEEAGLGGPEHSAAVESGLRWLLGTQAGSGAFGPVKEEFFYNHCLALYALAAGLCVRKLASLEGPVEKGLDYLLKNQTRQLGDGSEPAYLGWRYLPGSGESDTSVTSWAFLAMKEAEAAGATVPEARIQGMLCWIRSATNSRFEVGYLSAEDAGMQVKVPEINEDYKNHPAMTAAGVFVRLLAGPKGMPWDAESYLDSKSIAHGVDLLLQDLPSWDPQRLGNDYDYWHHGTYAMRLAGGKPWKQWREALEKCLIPHQRKDPGCIRGSWDADDRWGSFGGRIYATAINVLSLAFGALRESMQPIRAAASWKEMRPKKWSTVGVFPFKRDRSLSDQVFEPETKPLDLKASFTGADGKPVSWKKAALDNEGRLNLRKIYDFDSRIAYCAAFLKSEKGQGALLRVRSDGGVEIWVNGKKVHRFDRLRLFDNPEDLVPVELLAGANSVLVKASNAQGAWMIALALESPWGVQE